MTLVTSYHWNSYPYTTLASNYTLVVCSWIFAAFFCSSGFSWNFSVSAPSAFRLNSSGFERRSKHLLLRGRLPLKVFRDAKSLSGLNTEATTRTEQGLWWVKLRVANYSLGGVFSFSFCSSSTLFGKSRESKAAGGVGLRGSFFSLGIRPEHACQTCTPHACQTCTLPASGPLHQPPACRNSPSDLQSCMFCVFWFIFSPTTSGLFFCTKRLVVLPEFGLSVFDPVGLRQVREGSTAMPITSY